jgi:hypothetical protein
VCLGQQLTDGVAAGLRQQLNRWAALLVLMMWSRAGADRAEFAAPAPHDHGDAVLVVDELLDPAGPEQLPVSAGGAVEVEHGFLLTVLVGCCTATLSRKTT